MFNVQRYRLCVESFLPLMFHINAAKDQHGCRFLQKVLEERNPESLQRVLNEIYDHAVELMTGQNSA